MAIRAPRLAQLRDGPREGLVVRHELVLGDLDHEPGEVGGERLGHRLRGEGRGADVQRQVGADRTPDRLQRGADRRRVELRPEAAAVSLREPRLRRASRRARLKRASASYPTRCPLARSTTGWKTGLIPSGSAIRAAISAACWSVRPTRRARGRSGACAACPGASPNTGRRRRACRGWRRPPRRPGRWRCPPSRRAPGRGPRRRATACRARSAIRYATSPSVPGRISANSSPPTRAAVSVAADDARQASCPPPSAPHPRTGARGCR